MATAKRTPKGAIELVTMGKDDMVVKLAGGAAKENVQIVIRSIEKIGGAAGKLGICCDGLCCNGLKGSAVMTKIDPITHPIQVIEHITTSPR